MSIGGVNDYGSILQSYQLPVVSQNTPILTSEETQEKAGAVQAVDIHEEASMAPVRRDAGLEDISLTFNKQEEFDYIGRDSDIRSLDVEKAISDMKKDQILQQYQYFVGSARNF